MSKLAKTLAVKTGHTRNVRQAYVLIVLGLILLLGAWLLQLPPLTYPVGLLLFGLGMLIAAFFYPYRLLISGILFTCVGIAIFFIYKPSLPGSGSLLVPALGVALLLLALATRRGYISAGAISPALLVLIVGLMQYPPFTHLLPTGYAAFILSLWFPALGLLMLGIVYLLLSSRS